MKKLLGQTALALSILGATALSAMAQEALKIAYVDPLSGGGASIGQIGMNQLNFIADEINAKGGVNGKKVEVIGYDNQTNPQVSLVQVQKAIDEGIKVIVQGNGSSVAVAVSDFITKYNDRNPGANIVHLNYAAIDPVLTNEKCSYWHLTWDASAAIKMEALTNFIKDKQDLKKVYLISQDYSFGHAVAGAAKSMLQAKRPDVEIVGDELHPLGRIKDFVPYAAKIKASGADTVVTGNWSSDLTLLVKAANDAGLTAKFYTYYAVVSGTPTALGANAAGRVFQVGVMPVDLPAGRKIMDEYKAKFNDDFYTAQIYNAYALLSAAMAKAKSTEPTKVAAALEGLEVNGLSGPVTMRKADHQLQQTVYITQWQKAGAKPYDYSVENTGYNFRTIKTYEPYVSSTPTSCQMKRPS